MSKRKQLQILEKEKERMMKTATRSNEMKTDSHIVEQVDEFMETVAGLDESAGTKLLRSLVLEKFERYTNNESQQDMASILNGIVGA